MIFWTIASIFSKELKRSCFQFWYVSFLLNQYFQYIWWYMQNWSTLHQPMPLSFPSPLAVRKPLLIFKTRNRKSGISTSIQDQSTHLWFWQFSSVFPRLLHGLVPCRFFAHLTHVVWVHPDLDIQLALFLLRRQSIILSLLLLVHPAVGFVGFLGCFQGMIGEAREKTPERSKGDTVYSVSPINLFIFSYHICFIST